MGILKTAIKVGVATRVYGSVRRRQELRWAQEDAARAAGMATAVPPAAPAPPAAPVPPAPTPASTPSGPDDVIGQLQRLADLRSSGALSDAEFETLKQRLIGG